MNKIKVSWSVLKAWADGNREDAINMMNGIQMVPSDAMVKGKIIHKEIDDKKMEFFPFQNPGWQYEQYFRLPVAEWLDLSLVIDAMSPKGDIIIDWKTGATPITSSNPMQLYLYAYALSTFGVLPEWGIMAKINDNLELEDYVLVEITPELIELGRNYVETYGSEIYELLETSEVPQNNKEAVLTGVHAEKRDGKHS